MNQQDYKRNIERLKEIEAQVKDPSFSVDRIEALLTESAAIVKDCREYTRGLREKLG
jgi:hypothetical protein